MADDLISKPSRGRYFPFAHSELVAYVNERDFSVHSYNARLPVILENCDVECELGHQLCTFFRMGYLAEFSLPESVTHGLARRAVEFALNRFKTIDDGPYVAHHEQEFIVYRAYLGSLANVIITRHTIKGGSRSYLKFRSAAKLSKRKSSWDGQHLVVSAHVA